jgi:hypothetical protein
MSDCRRFVLNTHTVSAGTRVWIHDLAQQLRDAGVQATLNDWQHYDQYDVALFFPADEQILIARSAHPSLLIGLIDPKTSDIRKVRQADFLIVSSVEQRDFFLHFHPNIYVYYPFPSMKRQSREHTPHAQTVLAYHGNKVHLHAFFPHLTQALEHLADRHELELRVVYDRETLGAWKIGRPTHPRLRVTEVQWSPKAVESVLLDADIGLVPSLQPLQHRRFLKWMGKYSSQAYLDDPNDYLLRFKYSTNPGRLFVYSELGVPVVADFVPSSSQFVFHGYSGLLACSAAGWENAIEQLIVDPALRQTLAENLTRTFDARASRTRVFEGFLAFLDPLRASKTPIRHGSHYPRFPLSRSLQHRKQLIQAAAERLLVSPFRRFLSRKP